MALFNTKPTESELEILKILWEIGDATVKDVNDRLNLEREVGYTTTLKLMQIMSEKGILSRHKDGRSHVYQAIYKESETKNYLLNKFMNSVYSGSTSNLVLQALGNGKTSKQDLAEIKEIIEKMEREND